MRIPDRPRPIPQYNTSRGCLPDAENRQKYPCGAAEHAVRREMTARKKTYYTIRVSRSYQLLVPLTRCHTEGPANLLMVGSRVHNVVGEVHSAVA